MSFRPDITRGVRIGEFPSNHSVTADQSRFQNSAIELPIPHNSDTGSHSRLLADMGAVARVAMSIEIVSGNPALSSTD